MFDTLLDRFSLALIGLLANQTVNFQLYCILIQRLYECIGDEVETDYLLFVVFFIEIGNLNLLFRQFLRR